MVIDGDANNDDDDDDDIQLLNQSISVELSVNVIDAGVCGDCRL